MAKEFLEKTFNGSNLPIKTDNLTGKVDQDQQPMEPQLSTQNIQLDSDLVNQTAFTEDKSGSTKNSACPVESPDDNPKDTDLNKIKDIDEKNVDQLNLVSNNMEEEGVESKNISSALRHLEGDSDGMS